jgi:DNA-binding transcriptional ArsR family regulator
MREIRARLSEPAGRAWDRLLTEEGITASGLVEALGRQMSEGKWFPSTRALELARVVDKERRRR